MAIRLGLLNLCWAASECRLAAARRYGAAAGRAHLLVPVIQSGAESWPTELQLSPVQSRDLLLLCADVLRSSQVSPPPSPGHVPILLHCRGDSDDLLSYEVAIYRLKCRVANDAIW